MQHKLPPAGAYTGPDARERRYADFKRIREGLPPLHTGGPPRFTPADIAAIGEAAAKAVRAAVEASRTPAPPPRAPTDTDDRGSGDAYADRAGILLGHHARTAPRSYSLSDLVAGDTSTHDDNVRTRVALDQVFGGRLRN